ncbi:DMT family transporter [Halobaculum magnesiiphilum]|uniref:DMT family transporter n=1 Tax=Halobaculum magnesiiphilum TaxID=1017351 RepID=A0A8T8WIR2_9EURY|nr:DMT family transporter [Halobaculum magnesiiphilum]QZP39686.1 DMT family transporter [Halobaculum magnesiiphilum]
MNLRSVWRTAPTTGVLFVILATLWGGSFVAIEAGVKEWPPLLFAAIRYDLAGVLVLAVAAVGGGRVLPRTRGDLAAVASLAVFVVFAHHALLYVGQGTVPGAVASAVVALSPVLTALIAPYVLGAGELGRVQYLGVALGFLGVVAVTDPGSAGGIPATGTLLVFGATVAFAVGTVLLRRVRPTISAAALQGWGMLVGAVLLHGGSRALGEAQTVVVSTTGVATLAFLVVGPGVIAFLLYFRLLDSVGATRTMLVGYLEPIAAAGLSFALFGYVPTDGAVIGFLLVLGGFALVEGNALRDAAGGAVGRLRAALP